MDNRNLTYRQLIAAKRLNQRKNLGYAMLDDTMQPVSTFGPTNSGDAYLMPAYDFGSGSTKVYQPVYEPAPAPTPIVAPAPAPAPTPTPTPIVAPVYEPVKEIKPVYQPVQEPVMLIDPIYEPIKPVAAPMPAPVPAPTPVATPVKVPTKTSGINTACNDVSCQPSKPAYSYDTEAIYQTAVEPLVSDPLIVKSEKLVHTTAPAVTPLPTAKQEAGTNWLMIGGALLLGIAVLKKDKKKGKGELNGVKQGKTKSKATRKTIVL